MNRSSATSSSLRLHTAEIPEPAPPVVGSFMARSKEITLGDLPEPLRRQQPSLDVLPLELPHTGINIEAIEKELILRALRRFDWRQTHAAQFLDLSRKALICRMEKFGLRKEQQKGSQPGTKTQR